jgi:hypothetical protein
VIRAAELSAGQPHGAWTVEGPHRAVTLEDLDRRLAGLIAAEPPRRRRAAEAAYAKLLGAELAEAG